MAQSNNCSTIYNGLHDHLKAEILSWLPVECVCRFRSVSKQWNALLSSTDFITNIWRKKPPNMNPWLVIHPAKSNPGLVKSICLVYCFFTRTWKKTYSVSVENQNNLVSESCASAVGLFLLRTGTFFFVCNPLRRTSVKLPSISSTIIGPAGIVAGEGESPDTYKVVVVGKSSPPSSHIIEVYDSNDRSWRIAGHLSEENQMGRWPEMVFCDGSLYFLICINDDWRIIGFNIREGTSFSTPLPEMANEKRTCPYLLVCGSRPLVMRGIVKEGEQLLQKVIIWELENVKVDFSSSSSSRWKEIARMPPHLCEGINRTMCDVDYPFMCCTGVGDHACFVTTGDYHAIEVVVYNISEKTWSRLPNCPLDEDIVYNIWEGSVMAFEPRPDMKVL